MGIKSKKKGVNEHGVFQVLINSLFVDYMIDLLQVVQMNKHPLTVTFIAEADSITGELLRCEAVCSGAL